jgi:myo-inositol-1(or 4)-monophosphatase
MPDVAADLGLMIAAARRAGDVIMRYFGTELSVRDKGEDQPVTRADLEADALLRAELLGARPGYGWLSEETPDAPDRLGRRRVWIVDPLDGTRSFIAGRPEFAVSVGLVEAGAVVAGVVFNPARGELYHAVRGGGAFLDEPGAQPRRLRVTAGGAPEPLAAAGPQSMIAAPGTAAGGGACTLLASRSEIRAGDFDLLGDGWAVQPLGSTAYKMAWVAAGRAEAFLSRGPKSEWDVCAGTLIVTEAGGRVTDVAGAEPDFNRAGTDLAGMLATNGTVHEILLRRSAALPPIRRGASRAGPERRDTGGER